jgi:hypothetical protein
MQSQKLLMGLVVLSFLIVFAQAHAEEQMAQGNPLESAMPVSNEEPLPSSDQAPMPSESPLSNAEPSMAPAPTSNGEMQSAEMPSQPIAPGEEAMSQGMNADMARPNEGSQPPMPEGYGMNPNPNEMNTGGEPMTPPPPPPQSAE